MAELKKIEDFFSYWNLDNFQIDEDFLILKHNDWNYEIPMSELEDFKKALFLRSMVSVVTLLI